MGAPGWVLIAASLSLRAPTLLEVKGSGVGCLAVGGGVTGNSFPLCQSSLAQTLYVASSMECVQFVKHRHTAIGLGLSHVDVILGCSPANEASIFVFLVIGKAHGHRSLLGCLLLLLLRQLSPFLVSLPGARAGEVGCCSPRLCESCC